MIHANHEVLNADAIIYQYAGDRPIIINAGTFESTRSANEYGSVIQVGQELHLNGGKIIGNSHGIRSYGTVYIQGFTVFDCGMSDIQLNLNGSRSRLLHIEGKLTNTKKYCIDPNKTLSAGEVLIFTSGWSDHMEEKDPADFFTSYNKNYEVIKYDTGAGVYEGAFVCKHILKET